MRRLKWPRRALQPEGGVSAPPRQCRRVASEVESRHVKLLGPPVEYLNGDLTGNSLNACRRSHFGVCPPCVAMPRSRWRSRKRRWWQPRRRGDAELDMEVGQQPFREVARGLPEDRTVRLQVEAYVQRRRGILASAWTSDREATDLKVWTWQHRGGMASATPRARITIAVTARRRGTGGGGVEIMAGGRCHALCLRVVHAAAPRLGGMPPGGVAPRGARRTARMAAPIPRGTNANTARSLRNRPLRGPLWRVPVEVMLRPRWLPRCVAVLSCGPARPPSLTAAPGATSTIVEARAVRPCRRRHPRGNPQHRDNTWPTMLRDASSPHGQQRESGVNIGAGACIILGRGLCHVRIHVCSAPQRPAFQRRHVLRLCLAALWQERTNGIAHRTASRWHCVRAHSPLCGAVPPLAMK
mmetsp:Transcript_85724/g.239637  ORF Transcript_85724/g.239637 Transcript_85724/m.239637 type:complete len:412 (+) Transcript_85724:552-1787(+)